MHKIFKPALAFQLLCDLPWCMFYVGVFMMMIDILRYYSRSLTLTDTSLLYEHGLFTHTQLEIPLTTIATIRTEKIMSYGWIRIFTANDVSGLRFGPIKDPESLRIAIIAQARKPQVGEVLNIAGQPIITT